MALLAAAALVFWPRDPIRLKRAAMARADKYFDQKKYPEAIIEYKKALRIDPRVGEAHARLAEAYAHIDDARNAFVEYVTAADLLPEDATAQLRAGSALLLLGYAKEAGERADRVLEKHPDNLEAKILRANVTAGLRNLDDAVVQMYGLAESVADRPADQARVLLHLGVMELARGHRSDAEGILRKSTASESAPVTNHVALANYYWALGRHADAEIELKRVLALNAREPRANRALAALYIATDRVPEAEAPLKMLAESSTERSTRFVLADYYIVAGRVQEASAMLLAMAADTAFYAQSRLRLALIEHRAGRADKASEIIEATLRKEPTHPAVLLMKARLLAEQHRFDEALSHVKAALAVEPKSAEAYYLLGTMHGARNEQAEAIEAFTQVLKLRPNLVDALIRLSSLNLSRSDADAAARFAVQAVTNAPLNADARVALVRALIARGNLVEAERDLQPVLETNPKSAVVLTQQGRLLAARHEAAGAREYFKRALALDPEAFEPLGELVELEVGAGRPLDAWPLVSERIAKTPDNPAVLMLAARIQGTAGDSTKAEAALKRVIEVDPSNLRAFGALGQLYYAAGRLGEARRQFEELARQKTNSVGALTMLAMIEELDGQIDSAEKTYERALAIDRNAAVASNNLAWLLVRRGANLDVALQLAQTAKGSFPNEPEFSDTLGWIYVKKGLADLALGPLLDSVRAAPENAGFRFHLGMAYIAKSDYKPARAHLERAVASRQSFEGADEARRQVEWLRTLPIDYNATDANSPSVSK